MSTKTFKCQQEQTKYNKTKGDLYEKPQPTEKKSLKKTSD